MSTSVEGYDAHITSDHLCSARSTTSSNHAQDRIEADEDHENSEGKQLVKDLQEEVGFASYEAYVKSLAGDPLYDAQTEWMEKSGHSFSEDLALINIALLSTSLYHVIQCQRQACGVKS